MFVCLGLSVCMLSLLRTLCAIWSISQQHAAALQRAQSAPSTVEEPNKEVARDDRPQHKPRYVRPRQVECSSCLH